MSVGGLLLCLSDYPPDLVGGWVSGTAIEVVVADRRQPLSDLHPVFPRADVVIADAARLLVLDASALRRLVSCRLVIVPAVGIEGAVDPAAARALSLPVVNAPGYNADAVADWTVGAIIDALRRPVDLRTGGWAPAPLGRELGAITVGLVGYGSIGRAVAHRLRAFGTTILYTTSGAPGPDADHGWRTLPELVASSDVVSLHAPSTPATVGMIDAVLLATMRPDAVLVNTARGALVVEADLVAGLRSGRPAQAVLDVFAEEPLPLDHPLRALDTVRLTPHVAAGTLQARQRVRQLVERQVHHAFGIDGTYPTH